MTHTDLIARLRSQKNTDEMERHEIINADFEGAYNLLIRDCRSAADALTTAQERIEALEDALRNVVKSGSHQQARMIARASLPFAVAYRRHRRHLTAHPGQPIVSVPSTPAT